MSRTPLQRWICGAVVFACSGLPAASELAPRQTLCILDLNRQGDDDSMDWLRRGLADMLITSMSRVGPYQVVQRHQLRELMREHRLSAGSSAIQNARVARADLLLSSSASLASTWSEIEAGCGETSTSSRSIRGPANATTRRSRSTFSLETVCRSTR